MAFTRMTAPLAVLLLLAAIGDAVAQGFSSWQNGRATFYGECRLMT